MRNASGLGFRVYRASGENEEKLGVLILELVEQRLHFIGMYLGDSYFWKLPDMAIEPM